MAADVAATVTDVTLIVVTVPGSSPLASTAPPPDGTTCWYVPPRATVTDADDGFTRTLPPAKSRRYTPWSSKSATLVVGAVVGAPRSSVHSGYHSSGPPAK